MSDERPPGWYPDPFGTRAEDRRYWGGETWLAVTPPPEPQRTPQQQGAAPAGQEWSQRPAASGHAETTTPDGQPLASYGRRVGAYLIDGVIVGLLSLLVSFATPIWSEVAEYARSAQGASSSEILSQQQEFIQAQAGNVALLGFVSVLLSAAYYIPLIATRGATPGKLAVGIRVRMRDEQRPPGWRQSALRWLVHFGPQLVSSVPVISFVTGLLPLVDLLWPLWDRRRQALHDKAARTQVVLAPRRTP